MGRINVRISRELEQEFRSKVFERKGMKKGNITSAVEEAMVMWIKGTYSGPTELKLNNNNEERQEET